MTGVLSNSKGASAGLGGTEDSYLKDSGFSTKMIALLQDIKHDLWNTKRYRINSLPATLGLIN